ncbi:MAG: polymer-forming cytoskeletal protein [Deltaproteobacteria bacterium]|nr:polymer-forming cytoskeletal protein [Deltaproteobacteria bacterium]
MAPPQHPLTGFLGAGAVWSGDLSFEGRVRVDGTFKGRIYSEGVLEVGVSGRVEGIVDVAEAVVAGTLDGRLRVREHLLVTDTGVVSGELHVNHMKVEPEGRVEARITRILEPRTPRSVPVSSA